MLHKRVRQDLSLSLLMGALAVSWFAAGVPALRTQAYLPTAYNAIISDVDSDRDGIPDRYDARAADSRYTQR